MHKEFLEQLFYWKFEVENDLFKYQLKQETASYKEGESFETIAVLIKSLFLQKDKIGVLIDRFFDSKKA